MCGDNTCGDKAQCVLHLSTLCFETRANNKTKGVFFSRVATRGRDICAVLRAFRQRCTIDRENRSGDVNRELLPAVLACKTVTEDG